MMTDLAIRRLDQADLRSIVALAAGLDWLDEEHRYRLLFDTSEVYGLERAGSGDNLIGTVTLTRYGGRLAAVGMMLVAKEHGGRGHGRALMEHVMAAADGTTLMLFATNAGRPLYKKLGFVTLGVNTAHVGPYHAADPATTHVATPDDLPGIIELDRAVTGSDRLRLLTAYVSFADEMRVVREGGLITGYGGRWSKPGQTVIGPVIAPDDAAATALANDLAAPVAGQIRIEYGDDHPAIGGWATHHGVPRGGTTSLMTLGRQSLPGDRRRLYMPVTPALG